ncbi:MAG: glycosyltransferase family 9 protein [Steroidobacteraceae bacterium]
MARPLVMRCGAFGDMVLVTALIQQLHARFGTPVDVITSGGWARPLLAPRTGVGEIYTLTSRRTPYWLDREQQALVRQLRARGAGPAWYCDGGGHGRDLLRRAGIGDALVCDTRDLPWLPCEHFVERWLRMAALDPPALTPPPPPPPPRAANVTLDLTDDERRACDAWLARRGLAGRTLVAFQAGNKRTMRGHFRRRASNTKYWPEARWGEVIRGVRAALPDATLLLLGVREEFALNEDIAAAAAVDDLHNVADDLPIPVLLPLLARCHSLVSVDTGPAHVAAALGRPTVTLFGVADPARFRPGGVGTPVAVLTGTVAGATSILGITADTVLDTWRRLCGSRRTSPGDPGELLAQHSRSP